MKGVIVRNRYYRDLGSDYVADRLFSELKAMGVKIEISDAFTLLSGKALPEFAVFLDKDCVSGRLLEKRGVRLFNSADAVRICDDKFLTAVELDGIAAFPETLCSPLKYPVSEPQDEPFIRCVAERLGFPVIAKFCVGSLGAQVFLLNDLAELEKFHVENASNGRIIYQKYVRESKGSDIRVYVVGGNAVACVSRRNADSFKSNAEGGAVTLPYESPTHAAVAEKACRHLRLDYAAVDFFKTEQPLLAEVNSNAYFKDAEAASGVNIAACYARHILKELKCSRKV